MEIYGNFALICILLNAFIIVYGDRETDRFKETFCTCLFKIHIPPYL